MEKPHKELEDLQANTGRVSSACTTSLAAKKRRLSPVVEVTSFATFSAV
jgi:hypothetical protein